MLPNLPVLTENFHISNGDLIAVCLSWTDAGNEEYYKLFRTGSGWIEIQRLDEDILSWVDYTIGDDSSYQYQVFAYNNNAPENEGGIQSNIINVDINISKRGTKMRHPNFREEQKAWRKGYKRIVGLDEAGRGPLAAPVVAGAVFVKPKIKNHLLKKFKEIKDSKRLTFKKREEFYKMIINHPQIEWGVGRVSEKVIDKINILEATKLAMKRAVRDLESKENKSKNKKKKLKKPTAQKFHDRKIFAMSTFLVIDGNFGINLDISQKSIIKADEKVFSCAAASIIAKVTRDRMMKRYHKTYPQYGFDQHKGYPTKLHREMLKKYGSCKIHRKTFAYRV